MEGVDAAWRVWMQCGWCGTKINQLGHSGDALYGLLSQSHARTPRPDILHNTQAERYCLNNQRNAHAGGYSLSEEQRVVLRNAT